MQNRFKWVILSKYAKKRHLFGLTTIFNKGNHTMLISFTVENFRSFKEEATLSLVAGNGKEMRDSHVFTPAFANGVKSIDLLPSAVVYGPNASGKTNLIDALIFMKEIVGDCDHDNYHDYDKKLNQITPFLFSDKTNTEPSTFEVVMLIDGVRFQYGFSATQERIHGEWLYAFPNGRMQKWFERTAGKKITEYEGKKKMGLINVADLNHYEPDEYTFGAAFLNLYEPEEYMLDKDTKNKKDALRFWVGKNLLLSTTYIMDGTPLDPIQGWFKNDWRWIREYDIGELSYDNWDSTKYCINNGSKRIGNFLSNADTAIEDIEVDGKNYNIKMIHKTQEGGTVKMDLCMESDGTQRLFALAAPFLETLENGGILIADELEQRLHPALTRDLIGLFHDPKTNPKNAQLIFTTHDVSLLQQDIFRRDQIWFCERDVSQASTLFPLSYFKPRKGFENFEGYYMGGRYGALPFIGNFFDALKNDEDK